MNNKAFTVAAIVFVYLLVFVQYESYLRKTTNTIHEETHQPTESCPNFGPRWSMVVTEKTKIPGESYPFIPYKIHEPVVQYNPETPIEIYNAYKNWDAWRVNASEFITINHHIRVGDVKRFVHASNICLSGRKALYLTKNRYNISPPNRVWSGIFGNAYATLDDVANFTWINETTYLFDKHHWQRGHIGHFGFRAVQTHSMLEHAKEWNISDIKTIFFMTDDFPLPDWCQEVANIAGLLPEGRRALYHQALNGTSFCFKDAYYPMYSNVFFWSIKEGDSFREKAFNYFGIKQCNCPPKRILVLRRKGENRDYANVYTIHKAIEEMFPNTEVNWIHLNGEMTAKDQAMIVASYGIIISVHGSQMTNIIFAQPNAAVIELAPINWNDVWQRYLSAFYRLHHQIVEQGYPDPKRVPYDEFVNAKLNNPKSLERGISDLGRRVIYSNFVIDPTALKEALANSVKHLRSIAGCDNWNIL